MYNKDTYKYTYINNMCIYVYINKYTYIIIYVNIYMFIYYIFITFLK